MGGDVVLLDAYRQPTPGRGTIQNITISGDLAFFDPVNSLLTSLGVECADPLRSSGHAGRKASMLLLAFAFTASRPIFGHRLMRACIFCLRTIVHLFFALVVVAGSYGLALLAIVDNYTGAQPMADVVYGIGFAGATFVAVFGGTMVAPRWLAGKFMLAAGASTAMFPFGLYLHYGLVGDWRPVFLWYLSGSLAGSVAAMRLMSRASGNGCVHASRRIA
jgi:hypothetical protein